MKTTTEIKYGDMEYTVEDYGDICNDYICTIFGGEMLYNDLKKINTCHWETTNLVVKTHRYVGRDGKDGNRDYDQNMIHYEIYFEYNDKPVLELRYNENHSCDMNYHLGELKSQQEEENEENEDVYEIILNGIKWY